MKTTALLIVGAALTLTTQAFSSGKSAVPVGSLKVNKTMVRQGVAPILSWKIKFPKKVTDVVTIPPDDTIVPKTKLRVKVSMVGVGITDQTGREYPSKSYMKFGSSAWKHVFTGKGSQVRPDKVLIDRVVEKGEVLQFSAKVNLKGYGYYYNNSKNITVLKNGDTPPNVAAGYSHQTSVATYLRPYVKNGKIAIGPMDVLYVSELTHSNPKSSGYDMQDSIVLVQFEEVDK